MAKNYEPTVTKQSNGTVVIASKVSNLRPAEDWSLAQLIGIICAGFGLFVGQGLGLGTAFGDDASLLTLILTPIEAVLGVKGVNRYNKVESFFQRNSFKKPSGIDIAKIALGLKKKNKAIATGQCVSDSEPTRFTTSGTHSYRVTYDEFKKRAKEYEYSVVLNRTSKGLVMEQHFVPKPITLWDQALAEARTLHNV